LPAEGIVAAQLNSICKRQRLSSFPKTASRRTPKLNLTQLQADYKRSARDRPVRNAGTALAQGYVPSRIFGWAFERL
jgi:hypothetical protein